MSTGISSYGRRQFLYVAATPDEVATVMKAGAFHTLIVNTHVPKNYIETPVDECLSAYRTLFEKLASGARLSWEEDWSLFPCRHLTRDPSLCVWERQHVYRGRTYTSAPRDYAARCLQMEPFILYREPHEGRAATYSKVYSYTQFPEYTVGLQFHCATRRTWWDEDGASHTEDMTGSPDSADLQWLRTAFGAITKPLKFEDGVRVVNPGIRVSPAAKEALKGFHFFANGGYHII